MKWTKVFAVLSVVAVSATVGCGDGDLNKNVKPIDKNAPRPSAAGEGAGGNKKESGAGTAKAPKAFD